MKNFLFLVLGIAIGAAGGWFGHAHYCCKINCQNCCPAPKKDCCPAPVPAPAKPAAATPAGGPATGCGGATKAVKECATPTGAATKQESTVPPAKE